MSVLSQPPQSPLPLSLPPAPPCVGRGVTGNSGLSSHFRVVRAWVWAAGGDTAGYRGLGDASGGCSLGQGTACQPSGIPVAPFSKSFARLSYSFVCVRGPPTFGRSLGKCVQSGPWWPLQAAAVPHGASTESGCLAHHQPHAGVGLRLGGETGGHKDVLDPSISHTSLPGAWWPAIRETWRGEGGVALGLAGITPSFISSCTCNLTLGKPPNLSKSQFALCKMGPGFRAEVIRWNQGCGRTGDPACGQECIVSSPSTGPQPVVQAVSSFPREADAYAALNRQICFLRILDGKNRGAEW